MSQEQPAEELLFAEKDASQDDKDILDYDKAKERALRGEVGIFSVIRGLNNQVLELTALVCDKDNDLMEIHCEKNTGTAKYAITNYMFVNTVEEEKVMSWNPRMLSKEITAKMKKTFGAIFSDSQSASASSGEELK